MLRRAEMEPPPGYALVPLDSLRIAVHLPPLRHLCTPSAAHYEGLGAPPECSSCRAALEGGSPPHGAAGNSGSARSFRRRRIRCWLRAPFSRPCRLLLNSGPRCVLHSLTWSRTGQIEGFSIRLVPWSSFSFHLLKRQQQKEEKNRNVEERI